MFCKKCGKQLKEGTMFCTNCGEKVVMPAVKPQKEDSAPMQAPVKQKEPVHKPEGSGGQKPQMLIIVIGVLAVIVAVLAFVLLSKGSDKKEDEEPQGYEETAEDLPSEEEPEEPAPVEEPEPIAEPEEPASQYFLPESNSRYLSMEELEGFNEADCRLARNELYARYGRRFNDENLQAHFDSCEWYQGTIDPEDFDESVLNEYEIANRDLLVQYESILKASNAEGTATYSANIPEIAIFDITDGILTFKAEGGEEYGWSDIQEPFMIRCPIADNCLLEYGWVGYTPGEGDPLSYEDLLSYADRSDLYGAEEVSSPLVINAVVENGIVVKIYTLSH